MNEKKNARKFCATLFKHAELKADLYDGMKVRLTVDFGLRLAIEKLREVAAAITRHRESLAIEECIDVAHCAFLIWQALGGGDE